MDTTKFYFNGVPVVEICRSWWSEDYGEELCDIGYQTISGEPVPEADECCYHWLSRQH